MMYFLVHRFASGKPESHAVKEVIHVKSSLQIQIRKALTAIELIRKTVNHYKNYAHVKIEEVLRGK